MTPDDAIRKKKKCSQREILDDAILNRQQAQLWQLAIGNEYEYLKP